MFHRNPTQRFPLWQFLCQPLFDPQVPLVLNPGQFWREQKVSYLQRCWEHDCEQDHKPYRLDG